MAKKSFPLSKVYGLLEPGPVVMVTADRKGKPNIMTMSWHTMMEFLVDGKIIKLKSKMK